MCDISTLVVVRPCDWICVVMLSNHSSRSPTDSGNSCSLKKLLDSLQWNVYKMHCVPMVLTLFSSTYDRIAKPFNLNVETICFFSCTKLAIILYYTNTLFSFKNSTKHQIHVFSIYIVSNFGALLLMFLTLNSNEHIFESVTVSYKLRIRVVLCCLILR